MTPREPVPGIRRAPPPSEQIADYYRQQIRSGALSDGDPMDSVRQVVERWKVGTPTAQKVLRALAAEGLVETGPGKRPRVRAPD